MVISLLVLLLTAGGTRAGQQAGGVPAAGPRVKMVRSVAGTKGDAQGGTFVMADPRTTFYLPEDRQVIVYFEWEAPVGTHHCEGTLRGPNGQLAVMSSFDYPAKQTRFGGYWTVPLLETTTAGLWTFESHVDGETAGSLTIEIVAAKKPGDAAKEVALPTAAQIYARAVGASVSIEKLDAKGDRLSTASGFLLDDGQVLTAFRAIDGAHGLRIDLSDGTQKPVSEVAAWNRRQDWAILRVEIDKAGRLKRAADPTISIGDHCYWLDTRPSGGRVIAEGEVVGREPDHGWGERFSLSGMPDSGAIGGPVLNEHGEVIGLLGGVDPNTWVKVPIRASQMQMTFTASSSAIPIDEVKSGTGVPPTTLEKLWASGQFTPQITAERDVSFGMLIAGKPQKGKSPIARESKAEFTRQDQDATVAVTFQGVESWKNTVELQLFDQDNHRLVRSEPLRIGLASGKTQERDWSFPLTPLQPGVYRVDVLVGDEVAWRDFFRLRE